MTDELLFERLAAHGGPVDIDPGFEDRLYVLLQQEMRRSERSSRPALLLAAALAAILAISAAVAVGSGLIELPWLDRSPEPSPSASASASSEPSPTADQARDPGWSTAGTMNEERADASATVLLDGTVLVVGSVFIADAGPPSASAELYDPASRTWTTTGSMNEGRLSHSAVRLLDGRVLVVGVPGVPELYDPISGTWTTTGSPTAAEGGWLLALLPDGRVLAVGGGAAAVLQSSMTRTAKRGRPRGTWSRANLRPPAPCCSTGECW